MRHRAGLVVLLLTLQSLCGCGSSQAGTAPGSERRPARNAPLPPIEAPTQPGLQLRGRALFVDPHSAAWARVRALQTSDPALSARLALIAKHTHTRLLGPWTEDYFAEAAAYIDEAAQAGKVPVFAVFDNPYFEPDCGSHDWDIYSPETLRKRTLRHAAQLLAAVGDAAAVVVLEPGGLFYLDQRCLSEAQQAFALRLVREVTLILRRAPQLALYIDAGAVDPSKLALMRARLSQAGVADASGFALNFSATSPTRAAVSYGEQLSHALADKHFVIDTSLNGPISKRDQPRAALPAWCAVGAQRLGTYPTTDFEHPLVDALLWLWRPGQAQGSCPGGLRALEWSDELALGLIPKAPQ